MINWNEFYHIKVSVTVETLALGVLYYRPVICSCTTNRAAVPEINQKKATKGSGLSVVKAVLLD